MTTTKITTTTTTTYNCRYKLRSIDADVFNTLIHVDFLFHFQPLDDITQRTDKTTACCTVPEQQQQLYTYNNYNINYSNNNYYYY